MKGSVSLVGIETEPELFSSSNGRVYSTHDSGGALEQIQFLLRHASVQTTERYLGCKQNLGHPVNDLFNLKTDRKQPENEVAPLPDQPSRSHTPRTPQPLKYPR